MPREPSSETWRAHLPQHPRLHPLRPWLAEKGSLTARIGRRCRHFSVAVLRQARGRPHLDETRLLGIRTGRQAWVREVLLYADGEPVVFARSVLPAPGPRGAWRLFAGIGARPLGAALFADPLIRRGALSFRRLDARHPLGREAGPGHPSWARRSIFYRQGEPLLVTEVFLPGIVRLGA